MKFARHFESFKTTFRMYLLENYDIQVLQELQSHDESELVIDLDTLNQAMSFPKGCGSYANGQWGRYKTPYWFHIIHITQKRGLI